MKQIYFILGMLLALMPFASSCTEEKETIAPPVQYIELSELKKTMSVGETSQLTATVLPDGVLDKTITWKIEDENIGTIDNEGNITAIAEGETKVSAIVDNVTAICALTVVPVAVESVSLNETTKKMSVNETLQLIATILPENATYKDINWTSSDEDIATVDDNGLVTTHSTGNVAITAKSVSGEKTAVCNIVIVGSDPLMSQTEMNLTKNDEERLEVVLPPSMEGQAVTWSIDNEEIITVTADTENSCFATVKAIGIGSATITATIGGDTGNTVTCDVTVAAPKEEIDGVSVIMNLSLYANPEEVAAKILELDGKGITEYKLYGDFGKLGELNITKTEQNNPFKDTQVKTLDLTGIDAGSWPMVTVSVNNQNIEKPGIPDKAFNRGNDKNEANKINVLNNLETIILPVSCQALGYNSFQYTAIKTFIAPGVSLLGQSVFSYSKSLENLYLITSEEFQCHSSAFSNANSYSSNCTLYLNSNKTPIEGNKYFKDNNNNDISWISVDTTGTLPSE